MTNENENVVLEKTVTTTEHITEELDEITMSDQSDQSAAEYAASLGIQSVLIHADNLNENLKTNRKVLAYALIGNVLLVILLIVMFGALLAFPKVKYIPTKDNTAVCEVYPSNNPNLTDATITEFGKDAVLNLYTFDYINYEKQMNSALDHYFTPEGRGATVKAMDEAGITKYATDNALTFKATASTSARIEEKSKTAEGKDYWVVRFPMALDIYSGKVTPISTQKHMVTVRVVADTASAGNPNGLGVSSITLEPIK